MAANELDTPTLSAVESSKPKGRGPLKGIASTSRWYWLRQVLENPVGLASVIVLLIIVLAAIFAPLITPHNPQFLDPRLRLDPPGNGHLLGVDSNGRDIFARILYGARVSLLIGLTVTLTAGLLGAVLGLLSGFYDRLDTPIMRFMDGMMAFPSILLAIAIMATLGPGAINVWIALVIVYTPSIARLVRGSTLVIRNQQYVESARSIGMKDRTIIGRYIFRNALSPLIVQCTFVVAFSIISEASLSFLGAGVDPRTPTWGNMLRDGQQFIQKAWWPAVFPGIALVLLVLALNLLGDALRDALDPRGRLR
jgi:peptide/nickel transport system permease protein